jgi:RNA polymerase sigma-70 factor (ECF subfamily)
MKQQEELKIIERIKQGDSEAFSLLVVNYQNIVFSVALKLLKNREDAEEITQEAFIKAFRAIGSFRGGSKFSTWLLRIAYNNCISHLRKKVLPLSKTDILPDTEAEVDSMPVEDLADERLRNLETVLKQLPADEYVLIMMYYYEDLSVGDICTVTGLGESNVKVKLFRARNRLRTMMNEINKKEECLEI